MELIHIIRGETDNLVRTLRTDNGGEWSSKDFAAWLTKKGIRHETSVPHTPEQDGVSERAIRTVTEGTRSCLHDDPSEPELDEESVKDGTDKLIKESRLPTYLWAEAAAFTVYALNRVLTKASPVTPYEAWYHKKPNLKNLRTFGSIAYVHIPKPERKKLDRKSIRCVFVGYSDTQKGYRFWDPASRTVKISRDATFDEHHRLVDVPKDARVDAVPPDCPTPHVSVPEETIPTATNGHPGGEPDPVPGNAAPPDHDEEDKGEEDPMERSEDEPPPLRRSLRGRVPTKEWRALPAKSRAYAGGIFIPSNYKEAISCADAKMWMAAILKEYQSLMEKGTWKVVRCPPGGKAIKSRWIFDIKPGMNGEPQRYKARFVAKGYSQRPGIDFQETYASVVTHDTFRMVMADTAAEDLEAEQFDVATAFLNGPLEEEIYLAQPEGFIIPGRENEVCRLFKCIYGLKQASRAWAQHFTDFIKQQGLTQSKADPCLFFNINGTVKTALIVWVDDGIIVSNQQREIENFKAALREKFQIRSYPLERFVGITIARDRVQRSIHISQPDYIGHIIEKFHMATCFPKPVPAAPGVHLIKPAEGSTLETAFPYREAVGSLLYLALVSRPDISFAVGQVARFVASHNSSHVAAVRQIIAYLRGTPTHGILYSGASSGPPIGYTDADYAGCIDSRKSTSGSVFVYRGGSIAWSSRCQSCVAQSTAESEYIAAGDTTKEAVWIHRILPELQSGEVGPITIKCDNQAAITLVSHPDQRQKTKHIDVRYHFIRDQLEARRIHIEYVNTLHQLADILTKALPGPRFKTIREALGVGPAPVQFK